jgi:hypothetical protein
VLDAADGAALADAGFDADSVTPFSAGAVARLPVRLPLGQSVLGLQLSVRADSVAGPLGTIDVILRDGAGKAVGGLAIELTATD